MYKISQLNETLNLINLNPNKLFNSTGQSNLPHANMLGSWIILLIVVVVIQFLSDFVLFMELAGFTPFLPQLLALHLATSLDLDPSSLNQSFLSPLLLAFSSSCLVVLTFSCPLTSRLNAILKTLLSSLLSTCPYHLTPLAFANPPTISF